MKKPWIYYCDKAIRNPIIIKYKNEELILLHQDEILNLYDKLITLHFENEYYKEKYNQKGNLH